MKFLMKKVAAAVVATGITLAVGIGSAFAVPVFTINPNVIPLGTGTNVATANGTLAPFQADFVSGNTSELLHLTATGNFGSGWAQFNGFSLLGNTVDPLITGINLDYKLYLNFFLVAQLVSGANGLPGSAYNLTTLNFSVMVDPNKDNSFNNANAATYTEATITNTSDDITLAVGQLVTGVSGIDALGGAFLNSIQSFAVCNGVGTAQAGNIIVPAPCPSNLGSLFFAAPNPFYDLAFDAFNNTTQGVVRNFTDPNNRVVSITNAIGGVDFNRVPEPGSMALVGIALAGLGFVSRKRKAK